MQRVQIKDNKRKERMKKSELLTELQLSKTQSLTYKGCLRHCYASLYLQYISKNNNKVREVYKEFLKIMSEENEGEFIDGLIYCIINKGFIKKKEIKFFKEYPTLFYKYSAYIAGILDKEWEPSNPKYVRELREIALKSSKTYLEKLYKNY